MQLPCSCHAFAMQLPCIGYAFAMHLQCSCHSVFGLATAATARFAAQLPCSCHAVAMQIWPCRCSHSNIRLKVAMQLPCSCHALAMQLPCSCHALAMQLPCFCHASGQGRFKTLGTLNKQTNRHLPSARRSKKTTTANGQQHLPFYVVHSVPGFEEEKSKSEAPPIVHVASRATGNT